MRAVALAFIAPLLAAGCGSSPTCEEAVDHGMKVTGLGGARYGGERASLVKQCKDAKWSEELRTCVKGATSRSSLDACERYQPKKSSIEAYDDYMKKSKKSEAELNLNALQKSLKVHYIEMAAFPTGSAPLTPAAPCCEHSPDRKCPPGMDQWYGNPIWDALDFSVDEPGYFQYSYESRDGQTAIARAVGDLDCDLTTVTFELRCEVQAGTPACTLTKPDRAD